MGGGGIQGLRKSYKSLVLYSESWKSNNIQNAFEIKKKNFILLEFNKRWSKLLHPLYLISRITLMTNERKIVDCGHTVSHLQVYKLPSF